MRVSTLAKLGAVVGLLLLIWLLWPAETFNDWTITNDPPPNRTVVVIGDSLTAAYGIDRNESFSAELSRRLNVDIINAGISGDTTIGGLGRIERDVLSHQPGIVIIGLGGNDFIRRKPVDAAVANLRQMIQQAHAQGALVILIGFDFPLGSWNTRYRELAEESGAAFVSDALGGILGEPDLMHDEIHPNAAGYAIMADRIEPVLRRFLSSAPNAADLTSASTSTSMSDLMSDSTSPGE